MKVDDLYFSLNGSESFTNPTNIIHIPCFSRFIWHFEKVCVCFFNTSITRSYFELVPYANSVSEYNVGFDLRQQLPLFTQAQVGNDHRSANRALLLQTV